MSQSNSSSSTSAHMSPDVAKSGASRKYLLLFAVLTLVAAILYFGTLMVRETGLLGYFWPEPTAMPAVTHSTASSASSLRTVYAKKQLGECFELGRYPQGADGEIKPITWRVLQRNADNMLVIAEQGLDSKPYNEEMNNIAWAGCTLRRWLNSEFYVKAFNEQERECVLPTTNVNNEGPQTVDYIFLLSDDEARSLFASDSARCAQPTDYALKNGISTYNDCCWWWLRSHGYSGNCAVFIYADGSVVDCGHYYLCDYVAVRPALRIAL